MNFTEIKNHISKLYKEEKHREIISFSEKEMDTENELFLKSEIGCAYNNLSEYHKALDYLLPVSAKEKDSNPNTLYRIAFAYFFIKGEIERANGYREKCIKLDPNFENKSVIEAIENELGLNGKLKRMDFFDMDERHKYYRKHLKKQGIKLHKIKKINAEVNINDLEELYDHEIRIRGHEDPSLELHFETGSCSEELINEINENIVKVNELAEKAYNHLLNTFEGSDIERHYKELLPQLTNHEKENILNFRKKDKTIESQLKRLLEQTYITRIAYHPEENEEYFIFDFKLTRRNISNYIIVVSFNRDLEITELPYIES